MKSIIRYIRGYYRIKVPSRHKIRVANILLHNGIENWHEESSEEGDLCFCISEKDYKKLLYIIDKNGTEVYIVYRRGLPSVIASHRNRAGLLAGLFCFFLIIILSSFYIWDIKIVSDTNINHNEILANLKALGCYEGTFVPSLDFDDLCIDYVNKHDNCSWISVNVKGTVAEVEIREREIYSHLPKEVPCNLVASHDAVIEDFQVYSGKSLVEQGNVVKKGDLLVSGIVEKKDQSKLRLCHAEGEVWATVDSELRVEVPFDYKKQEYTGQEWEKRQVRFFNFTFPVFSTVPKKKENCTHLTEYGDVVLFDEIELPLTMEKEVYRQYELKDARYTKEQAQAAAEHLMENKFAAELSGAQIIKISTNESVTDTAYILTCSVKCRMNIAKPVEIQTN